MWRQGFLLLISFNAFLCWKLLLLGLPPLLAGPELLEPNDYWLPGEVVPVHYDLKLAVHMDNLTTRGEVVVMVKVVKATSNITLHANSTYVKIDHDKVAVKGPDGKEIAVEGHTEDREKEFYTRDGRGSYFFHGAGRGGERQGQLQLLAGLHSGT